MNASLVEGQKSRARDEIIDSSASRMSRQGKSRHCSAFIAKILSCMENVGAEKNPRRRGKKEISGEIYINARTTFFTAALL